MDNDKIKFTSAVKEKNYISMNLVHSGTYMNFDGIVIFLNQFWNLDLVSVANFDDR